MNISPVLCQAIGFSQYSAICVILAFFVLGGDNVVDIPTTGIQKYLIINGVEMPTPSSYEYTEADFDSSDSTRTETGVLVRKRIRRGVHTIKCKWSAITTEQLNIILKAIEPVWVTVKAFSPKVETGDHLVTFTGYAQATRTSTVILPRYNARETLWSIECSFIEQ